MFPLNNLTLHSIYSASVGGRLFISLHAAGFDQTVTLCRRCPGVHLATTSLWFVIASILATFDIKKPLDGNGVPIEPNVSFDNSIFRYVLPCGTLNDKDLIIVV